MKGIKQMLMENFLDLEKINVKLVDIPEKVHCELNINLFENNTIELLIKKDNEILSLFYNANTQKFISTIVDLKDKVIEIGKNSTFQFNIISADSSTEEKDLNLCTKVYKHFMNLIQDKEDKKKLYELFLEDDSISIETELTRFHTEWTLNIDVDFIEIIVVHKGPSPVALTYTYDPLSHNFINKNSCYDRLKLLLNKHLTVFSVNINNLNSDINMLDITNKVVEKLKKIN